MKKTLIAIAALAATGAFAQSSVTISGVVDVGFQNSSVDTPAVAARAFVPAVSESGTPGTVGAVTAVPATPGVRAAAAGTTKNSTFAHNGASTSALFISGVEDLGGGLKASFWVESNWNLAATGGSTAAFGSGQVFLGLEGGFGGIKLGAPNSAILQTALAGDSFGTAVGGNYSGRFSSTGNGTGTRIIRNSNTVRYDTPTFSGFSGSYEFGFANKNAPETNYTSTGVGILGLRYAAGPLNVSFATGTLTGAGAAATGVDVSTLTPAQVAAAARTAVSVSAATKATHTLLSANYAMGAATLFAGLTQYKAEQSGVIGDETSSMNFGVRYNVSPVLNVHASMANRKDKRTATAAAPENASLLALGANYSLSKRTTAYGRYESLDTNKASGVVGDTTGKGTLLAIGVRHNF